MEMTLDEFLADNQATLERFAAYWREQAKVSPDLFPEKLGAADWWEQLVDFASTPPEPSN